MLQEYLSRLRNINVGSCSSQAQAQAPASDDHNPCFSTFFLQQESSLSLRIPPSFVVENLNGMVSHKVSLKNMSGSVWHAELKYLDGYMHITSGWNRFAEDHKLKTGDFLVFQYLPDSTFLVIAFDSDGCNKHEPLLEKEKSEAKLQFERDFNTSSFNNFVTVPREVVDECVVKLPQRVELSFEEGTTVTTWLRTMADRVIIGYRGILKFWKMNKVKKGEKLQFQFICGEGKIVKRILVRKIAEAKDLRRDYDEDTYLH